MNLVSRPRVFISSTIFDFSDLRSAIKYWLEEEGFEVSASEFNDFKKDLALNSYEACLQSIEHCQYFVLLIGSRAGGRVATSPDCPESTITMEEYRRAYKLAQKGRLKIIVLVRKSIWILREDRQALEAFLSDLQAKDEYGLDSNTIGNIANHPSKTIRDSKIIFDFISEVARAQEMKSSIKEASKLPVNNWIHTFNDFREIVDIFRTTISKNRGLRKAALIGGLRAEISKNLALLHHKTSEGIKPYYSSASDARKKFNGEHNGRSSFSRAEIQALCEQVFISSDALMTQALQECINSGEFLDYRVDKDSYIEGPVHAAFVSLREAIRLIQALNKTAGTQAIHYLNYIRGASGQSFSLPNIDTASLISLHDVSQEIVRLSIEVLRYIEHGVINTSNKQQLYPLNPFKKYSVDLTPSTDEMIQFAINEAE